MLADGVYRLASGAYFGNGLGPWASLVARAGIDPLAPAMAQCFVVFGVLWLAAGIALALARGRYAIAALAVATLWYLPVGTLFSIIVLAVVLRPMRAAALTVHGVKDP